MPITMNDLFRGCIAEEYTGRIIAEYCQERRLTVAQLNLEWAKEYHRKTPETRSSFARWIQGTYPSAAANLMKEMWPGGNALEELSEPQQSLWNRFLEETNWAPPGHKKTPSKTATPRSSGNAAPEPSPDDLDLAEIEILVQCALDETLDTLEGIHTDGDFLVRLLRSELDHTVDPVSRRVPADSNFANMSTALRDVLYRTHAAYMVWSRILGVLETLERRGIETGSALLEACTQDVNLFWDTFSLVTNLHILLSSAQAGELVAAFSSVPHLASCFDNIPSVTVSSDGQYVLSFKSSPDTHKTLELSKHIIARCCSHFATSDISFHLPVVQYFESCTPEERAKFPGSILDILGRLAPTLYILYFLSFQRDIAASHPLGLALGRLYATYTQSNPLAPPSDDDSDGEYEYSLLQGAAINSSVFEAARESGDEGLIPYLLVKQEFNALRTVIDELVVPSMLHTPQVLQQPAECLQFWNGISKSLIDTCDRHGLKKSQFMQGADFSFYLNIESHGHGSAPTIHDALFRPQKKIIALPRKQAKLFRKVFSDAPPANIKWSELENAMRASGFDVVPIAGTAVRFRPRDERDRPVVLYRPHPGKELSPLKVKEVARVLGRRYGWTADMFVEA